VGRYKIAVCAIAKNEAKNAAAWYKSMSEADEIYVLDTGSTDGTDNILRSLGAKVFTAPMVCDIGAENCFRFDKARNLLLERVPDDFDIVVTTDLDERLNDGWRDILEKAWNPKATHARYLFNWSFYPDGKPKQQTSYYRINARKGLKWRGALHEYPGFDRPRRDVIIPGLVLNHYQDETKPRAFYLELSKVNAKENPDDPRVQFFLGRDYYDAEMWRECAEQMERLFEMARTPEIVEMRADAMMFAGLSYHRLDEREQAYSSFHKSISEFPYSREHYVQFAAVASDFKDWGVVYMCASTAIRIKYESGAMPNNQYSGDYRLYDLAAEGAAGIGLYDEALAYAETAARFSPGDLRILDNIRKLKTMLNKRS
jgi:hypothetical protein